MKFSRLFCDLSHYLIVLTWEVTEVTPTEFGQYIPNFGITIYNKYYHDWSSSFDNGSYICYKICK